MAIVKFNKFCLNQCTLNRKLKKKFKKPAFCTGLHINASCETNIFQLYFRYPLQVWSSLVQKKKKLAYEHSSQQQESSVDRNVLSTVALLNKFRYNVEIDGVIG